MGNEGFSSGSPTRNVIIRVVTGILGGHNEWELGPHTLPKTNRSPLKIGGWKMNVLFGRPMFRGYASFREGAQLD